MRFLIFRPVSRARCAKAGIWEEAMSRWQLFWAVAAMATAPLFAETTTDDYKFRYSTLERVGALSLRPTSEVTGLSFTLSDETFDKAIDLGAAGGPAGGPAGETVTEWRPVAFVPPEVKVTAISVAIPGSDAPASLTVTPNVAEGETKPVQFDLDDDAASETVSLVGADGIAHTATLRTYKNTDGVTLDPGKPCAFRFADSQTGTAISNFYTFGDKVPHLRVTGTASITRHVFTIDDGEQHSFNTLLEEQTTGYQDEANHVIVVEFSDAGGTLEMNAPLQNAPLVIGSSVSLTEASTKAAVSFDSDFAVPLSLRDGEGGKGGLSLTFGEGASFNPSALLLACDVTLKSPSTSRRMRRKRGSPRTTSPSPRAAPSAWSSPARWAPRTTCRPSPSPMPPAVWNLPPTPLARMAIPWASPRNISRWSSRSPARLSSTATWRLAPEPSTPPCRIWTPRSFLQVSTPSTSVPSSRLMTGASMVGLPTSGALPLFKRAARVILVRNSLSTPRSATLFAWKAAQAQSGAC